MTIGSSTGDTKEKLCPVREISAARGLRLASCSFLRGFRTERVVQWMVSEEGLSFRIGRCRRWGLIGRVRTSGLTNGRFSTESRGFSWGPGGLASVDRRNRLISSIGGSEVTAFSLKKSVHESFRPCGGVGLHLNILRALQFRPPGERLICLRGY